MSTTTRLRPIDALSPRTRLLMAVGALLLAMVAFMTLGVTGNLGFVMQLRGEKVAAMVLVGWSTGVATVAFQTITNNRLLTPSILGLDALYVFIQTMLIFLLGVTFTSQMGPFGLFSLNVALMLMATMALTGVLFGKHGRSVYVLVLAGLVLGSVLRALSSLIMRILDPTSYLVLQNQLFASFSAVDPRLLWISAVLSGACSLWLWRQHHTLDVVSLGREQAVSLGVPHTRFIRKVLLVATLMVCVSTALVGPITFLGLIVAAVAYEIAGNGRHAYTMPMAGLLGVIVLVAGQTVLENLLGWNTVLSVVIEFVGGIAFIMLVIRSAKK